MANDNAFDDEGQKFVVGIMGQMMNDAHLTAQQLIDDGEEYRNRFHVLAAAVMDLADEVDSRKLARRLEYMVTTVERMSRDKIAGVADQINTSFWDRHLPRLPYGVI